MVNELHQSIRQFRIHDRLPITCQQTEVGKQRSLQKWHFRQDVILPISLPGISSRHGQFALDNRPIQLRRRFHLHQSNRTILHPHQKVRDDI